MKALSLMRLACRLSALAFLLSGCATDHPVVSAWKDAPFAPELMSKIALIKQLHPSPETARLGDLLTTELKREGFNIVPIERADYLMAYSFEDELVAQPRSVTVLEPGSPPQTTGQVIDENGTAGNSSESTIPAKVLSQPVVFRNRGIRLFLYSNPKTHPGGFRIIWQGYIRTGQATSSPRESALVKSLLGYLGQEYHGRATLAP